MKTITTDPVCGMDGSEEVAALERVLKPLPGVQGLSVNLVAGHVTVAHDASVRADHFIAAIAPTGMKARLPGGAPDEHACGANRTRTVLVGASGVLMGLGLILHWTKAAPESMLIAVNVAAIITGGWFIFPKAIAAMRRFAPDMNLLMTIAVMGAAAIGEWSEGAAVTFPFGLSELLEAFSVQRARRAIESLLALASDTALVKRGEQFEEVPVAEVKLDEIVAVKSSQRVPLDGTVIAGASAVNQAPITGEPILWKGRTLQTLVSDNPLSRVSPRAAEPGSDFSIGLNRRQQLASVAALAVNHHGGVLWQCT